MPDNIYRNRKKYQVKICHISYGSYQTVEEAIEMRNTILKQLKEEEEERIMKFPMLVNDGIPIIELFNKAGKKVAEMKTNTII